VKKNSGINFTNADLAEFTDTDKTAFLAGISW